jgi:hypothetical protein
MNPERFKDFKNAETLPELPSFCSPQESSGPFASLMVMLLILWVYIIVVLTSL